VQKVGPRGIPTSEVRSGDNLRHRFHSLCPYFAMFPETFAQKWIERLTAPGDVVLDPFSGRGTTALTALLLGRQSIAADVNDVAYCLTRAKTQPPRLSELRCRLASLHRAFGKRRRIVRIAGDDRFFEAAFAPHTLSQLLFLRDRLCWKQSRVDCMIAALVLGSLHGESQRSPSYMSNQMPRTISTKPAYSVRFWKRHGLEAPERDVFEIVGQRATFRYESKLPVGSSTVIHGDMRKLPQLAMSWPQPANCVITSPPYLDVTNFEEDQWLRLWFLGGPPYPTTNRISRDDRYGGRANYWSFIADMWRSLGGTLARRAHVVIRIGSRIESSATLRTSLKGCATLSRRKVSLVSCRESEIQNRQTPSFRPGARGCRVETDFHFYVQ
jgi:hypothetical protein